MLFFHFQTKMPTANHNHPTTTNISNHQFENQFPQLTAACITAVKKTTTTITATTTTTTTTTQQRLRMINNQITKYLSITIYHLAKTTFPVITARTA